VIDPAADTARAVDEFHVPTPVVFEHRPLLPSGEPDPSYYLVLYFDRNRTWLVCVCQCASLLLNQTSLLPAGPTAAALCATTPLTLPLSRLADGWQGVASGKQAARAL
jgi:hypothetical protein